MSKILIGLETPGKEHIYDAIVIGEALAKLGHQIVYVVPDPVGLSELLDKELGAVVLPAAALARMPDLVHRPPGIGSLIDWYALNGMGEASHLATLTGIWAQQLQAVRPDLVVAIGAPTLWLAGPKFAPTIIAGDGAALPPIVDDTFPRFSADAPPAVAHNVLVDNINVALTALSLPRVDRFAELMGRCIVQLYGLKQFDPYLPQRAAQSVGMLGQWPRGNRRPYQPRLAMFLDVYCPNIESLLVAMGGLEGMTVDLFIKGATPSMRGFLQSIPAVKLWDSFTLARRQIWEATILVHHGVGLLATDGLVLGKPQLVLPWTYDQTMVHQKLEAMGVAWAKNPSSSIHSLGNVLREMPSAAAPQSAATHHAKQLAGSALKDGLASILAVAGSLLAQSTPNAMPLPQESATPEPAPSVAPAVASQTAASQLLGIEPAKDLFCALPFQHTCITSEGTARICCMTTELISKDGVPMSLYAHSLEEIWNSDYMRQVRRDMANGKRLKQCEVCYQAEGASGASYRIYVGLQPLRDRHLDRAAVAADEAKDFRVEQPPGFVKLELGNLCNLKCRMCNGGASSEVERDPVHTAWTGGAETMHAVWQVDHASIGPQALIGVAQSGVHPRLEHDRGFQWSNGRAVFDVPIYRDERLLGLDIDFAVDEAPGQYYFVHVNGKTLARGRLASAAPRVSIDLRDLPPAKQLSVEIESAVLARASDLRTLGLPIANVTLRRAVPSDGGKNKPAFEVLAARSDRPGPWYKDNELIFGQLLGDLDKLQRLYVTGGEPLLEPKFAEIVRYLIDKGVAGNIDLELNTNCTRIEPQLVGSLNRFRSLNIVPSLDGVGRTFEYIRHPGRWDQVSQNVRLLKKLLPNALLCVSPVIQAYNLLDLVPLCRFCDELDLQFTLLNLIQIPDFLKIEHMPYSVRSVAARRLREYAARDCRPQYRQEVLNLAQYVDSPTMAGDEHLLRQFMLFTNDLDARHGQSIRDDLPELYALLGEGGVVWTDELRYAAANPPRLAARERAHAWV